MHANATLTRSCEPNWSHHLTSAIPAPHRSAFAVSIKRRKCSSAQRPLSSPAGRSLLKTLRSAQDPPQSKPKSSLSAASAVYANPHAPSISKASLSGLQPWFNRLAASIRQPSGPSLRTRCPRRLLHLDLEVALHQPASAPRRSFPSQSGAGVESPVAIDDHPLAFATLSRRKNSQRSAASQPSPSIRLSISHNVLRPRFDLSFQALRRCLLQLGIPSLHSTYTQTQRKPNASFQTYREWLTLALRPVTTATFLRSISMTTFHDLILLAREPLPQTPLNCDNVSSTQLGTASL